MTLGDRIHYLRTEKGYTLQELGDKVGVGASTVRKWETGYIKTLRTDKMQKLSNALGTSVDYLMGWTDNSVNVGTVGTNNGVIGQNSGEMVTVRMNGKHEILGITIKPEAVDPDDIEMLEDLVAAAVNATVKQVDETAEAEMGKLTGGLNIPGL